MGKIRISGLVEESIVDGPGIRFVVFTQGCSHNCIGCHNTQTHSYKGGKLVDIDEILNMVKSNKLLRGITLSGGEPFDQVDACSKLAIGARQLGLDVVAYTGYTIENIMEDFKKIKLLENIDILIDGPFIIEKKDELLRFRGSSNQRIINIREFLDRY